MHRPLQPLRVPTGWMVVFNDLHEIDAADVTEDDRYAFLKEDLLLMAQEHFNRQLDVGWYPEGDSVDGAYRFRLLEGSFDGRLLCDLRTRDLAELVAGIERLLQAVCDGRL